MNRFALALVLVGAATTSAMAQPAQPTQPKPPTAQPTPPPPAAPAATQPVAVTAANADAGVPPDPTAPHAEPGPTADEPVAVAVTTAAPIPSPPPAPSAWMADTYAAAHRAVVRVQNARTTGSGFVFGDASHVATAYHLVKSGRKTSVVTVDGREIEARITSVDSDNDLAILTLSSPVTNITPLTLRDTVIRIGEPVIVIGHPLSPENDRMHGTSQSLTGLLDWSMSAGVVGAVNESQLQIDAALNPGNSGGPVLGEDGHVVGIVTGKLVGGMPIEGLGFATRADALAALQKKASPGTSDYFGQVSVGLGGGLSIFSGPWGTGAGVTAALTFNLFDLFDLRGHLTLGWGHDSYYGVNIVDRDFFRVAWDAILEYRIAARIGDRPFLATIGGGVGMIVDETTDIVGTGTVNTAGCTNTSACPVELTFDEKNSDRSRFMPELTLGLGDAVRFSWMFDPEHFGDNYVVQLTLGYGI